MFCSDHFLQFSANNHKSKIERMKRKGPRKCKLCDNEAYSYSTLCKEHRNKLKLNLYLNRKNKAAASAKRIKNKEEIKDLQDIAVESMKEATDAKKFLLRKEEELINIKSSSNQEIQNQKKSFEERRGGMLKMFLEGRDESNKVKKLHSEAIEELEKTKANIEIYKNVYFTFIFKEIADLKHKMNNRNSHEYERSDPNDKDKLFKLERFLKICKEIIIVILICLFYRKRIRNNTNQKQT